MKRVKLLFYSHFFTPSVGGVETIVLSLARGLAELRSAEGRAEFDVTVVTEVPHGPIDDAAFPFRVVREPGIRRLWRLVRSSDVIHLAGPAFLPLALGKLGRKPVVLEHHGYQAICPNGLLLYHPSDVVCPGHFQQRAYLKCLRCNSHESSALRSWVSLLMMFPRRFLARRVSATVAVTQHVADRLGGPSQARVVYHGIELSSQVRTAPERTHEHDSLCFAYVGRLVREKGVSVLLEAVHILQKEGQIFEVRVIGDGPDRPSLEAQVASWDLASRVAISGFLSGSALESALHDVDVVVVPTVMEETAGLAAIEHMMRGRLVIASNIGGLPEILGESGLKFPAGDPIGLADAMRMVIREPSLIKALGQKARKRASDVFTRQEMIEGHARIYRSLGAGQKP